MFFQNCGFEVLELSVSPQNSQNLGVIFLFYKIRHAIWPVRFFLYLQRKQNVHHHEKISKQFNRLRPRHPDDLLHDIQF